MSVPARHVPGSQHLDGLLAGITDAPPVPVTGLTDDSRRVHEGSLFVARQGATHHGLDFVDAVAAAGAAAVLTDRNHQPERKPAIPIIAIDNLEYRVGEIADRWYGAPSADLRVTGVTGTNGKTTVAWLAAQCFTRLGLPCGYSGTVGYGLGELRGGDGMTSPGVIETHARLAEFRDAGAACAAIEVSSHALVQRRVDGVRFDAAILTNLTRDHLDYHGDMAAYADAKARLFREHGPRNSIVNIDSAFGARFAAELGERAIAVSTREMPSGNRGVRLAVQSAVADGTQVLATSAAGDVEFLLPLVGEFNVANAACVFGLLLANGILLDDAADALAGVSAPPGRLQRVPAAGPAVYIDYAHTPDALQQVLSALRPHTAGRLWCVFGCGGDRDAGKRPQMGRVAAAFADRVVVTNDNPRSEDPTAIIGAILRGIGDDARPDVIEDRAAAIAWTIDRAGDDDVVLIAGKGHETCQHIGARQVPFSDYAVAAAALGVDGGSA